MIAYRAETRMMAPVIGAQGKKPNARRLLRALLTSDANIIPEPAQHILRIQLLGLGSDACDRMLAPLIEELNATRTIYPGTQLTLVYEMAADSPLGVIRFRTEVSRPHASATVVAPRIAVKRNRFQARTERHSVSRAFLVGTTAHSSRRRTPSFSRSSE